MYKKAIYAAACCLMSFFTVGLSYAEEAVDYRDARNSLIGNTVEGRIISRDTNYKMYLHPSGKLIRLDGKDVLEKGAWRITENSELCLAFASEECRTIKKRGDAEFDLYNAQNKLELTIDQVKIGNPYKMEP